MFVRKEVQVLLPHITRGKNYVRMDHDAAASRFPNTYQNLFPQNEYSNVEELSPVDSIPEEPNPKAKKFFEMPSATNSSLYDGCKNYSHM